MQAQCGVKQERADLQTSRRRQHTETIYVLWCDRRDFIRIRKGDYDQGAVAAVKGWPVLLDGEDTGFANKVPTTKGGKWRGICWFRTRSLCFFSRSWKISLRIIRKFKDFVQNDFNFLNWLTSSKWCCNRHRFSSSYKQLVFNLIPCISRRIIDVLV